MGWRCLSSLGLMVFVFTGFHLCKGFRFPDYTKHPCLRRCTVGENPRTCEYDFILEYNYVLSKACYDCPFNITDCYRPHCVATDGVHRAIMTVNRRLPGPAIHVCHNDTIVVNVKNKMEGGEGTSIHWHGIYQHDSQIMDGVGMLTQCPIPVFSSFQYRFKAENPGTHFWHAHSGAQRSDGVFGSLVVHQPDSTNPQAALYQHDLPEHVIIVNDWLDKLAISKFTGENMAGLDHMSKSMLINGRGSYQKLMDEETNRTAYTPRSVFKVTQAQNYRFRVINPGIMNCPIQMSVDNHRLKMIASDGVPFVPKVVDSFIIFAGERFDFVLETNQTVGNYWIRARGLSHCMIKKTNQAAILRYEGADETDPPGTVDYESADRAGTILNPLNKKSSPTMILMADLNSTIGDDPRMKEKPDKKFYIAMDFYEIDNYNYHDPDFYSIFQVEGHMKLLSPQMNHISLMMPPSPPLTQYSDLSEDLFCNTYTVQVNCSAEFCECAHKMTVGVGDTVEIVLIDEGATTSTNHPIHLHGHNFRVVAMDRLGESTSLEEVKALDTAGGISRKLSGAIAKDTVTVPDGGYTVIRFVADNPGFWLLHCHIESHLSQGMGSIIQVGQPREMPKPPKGWPRCGDWKYTGEGTGTEIEDTDKTGNTCPPTNKGHGVTIPKMFILIVFLAMFMIV
ncbi:laccase-1-like [Gigantopelta aegis]|uniref:laccase-1-like n=1 Tax=Gigantopelta aegis TaxID=1735272 RepID=UPI001B88B03C|nr:laccase-1-like [Gigantopelta aegis]